MKKIQKKLTPKFLKPYIKIYKDEGFKSLIKKGGFKLLLFIFLFYLVRDSILYIIIPLIAYYGINNLF
ncbi:MAG: hypothetical protein CMG07_02725 [Candidatus Marinimicrobia bacterium]|nr:hypothetical protein [Candidatus Neomarinimicrobiota bacterium]